MQKILSVGEATMDVFQFLHEAGVRKLDRDNYELTLHYADKIPVEQLEFSVGGNAANTAVAFARLGFESQLYSMVGSDYLSKEILRTFEKEGIDTRYVQSYEGRTSYTTALVYEGERTLLIYHVPHEYNLPNFEPVDWVYLTSMGKAYRPAYDKVLSFVKAGNIKMSFNPGTFQFRAGVTALKPYLAATEALFLNVDESRHLTELPLSAKISDLAEALYDFGPKVVVITDGSKGAYCFDGRELLFCDIFPIKVLERTGAGDSFASGFTAALASGKDTAEAMRWGMAESAAVVAAIGPEAGLLTKEQMAEYLSANSKVVPKVIRH